MLQMLQLFVVASLGGGGKPGPGADWGLGKDAMNNRPILILAGLAADAEDMVSFPAEFPFVRKPEHADAPHVAPKAELPPEPMLGNEEVSMAGSSPSDHASAQTALALVETPVAATPAAVFSARPAARPSFAERRKVRRDPLVAGALVRIDGQPGPPVKVAVTEISVAGVRFRASQPFQAGEKAQIRLEVGPLRWTTRLRVVHCSNDRDGASTIGCAFLRTELLRPWTATAA